MAMGYATLSLGTTAQPGIWNKRCTELGLVQMFSSIKLKTPAEEIRSFFGTRADWVLMSGHSDGSDLYGDTMPPFLQFKRDHTIEIMADDGKTRTTLDPKSDAFRMNSVKVLFFTGCCIFLEQTGYDLWALKVIRAIFGKPVILGTSFLTGRGYTQTMFDGLNDSNPGFFKHYKDNGGDPVAAWMETARKIYGNAKPDEKYPILRDGKGVSAEENFRALDVNGQEWMIRDKKLIKARNIG